MSAAARLAAAYLVAAARTTDPAKAARYTALAHRHTATIGE